MKPAIEIAREIVAGFENYSDQAKPNVPLSSELHPDADLHGLLVTWRLTINDTVIEERNVRRPWRDDHDARMKRIFEALQ